MVNRYTNLKADQKGFTLVEFMLAMALFAYVLLFATVGYVQVNKSYNQGITAKRVQETARLALEDISQNVRLSKNIEQVAYGASYNNRLCLDNVTYAWNYKDDDFNEVNGEVYALEKVKENNIGNCDGGQLPIGSQVQRSSVVEEGLWLHDLTISEVAGSDEGLYEISITISTDQDDLLDGSSCKPGVTGFQYCSSTTLTTSVNSAENLGGL